MTAFIEQLYDSLFDLDRLPYAIAALLLVMIIGAITGPILGNANSFIYWVIDKILGSLGDKMDRTKRPRVDLVFRGFVLTAISLFIAATLGQYASALISSQPAYGVSEIIVLALMLSAGTVWIALLRLYRALENKDIGQGAYYAIARSMRVNLSNADDFGITRAGLNFSARSFDKNLVAPLFWYIVGGIPLALVYSFVAAFAWRFGKDGFSKGFGAAPLVLERLLGLIPSIISALILTIAALFTPTAKTYKGFTAWLGYKDRAPYAQGGLPISVLAWSLNLIIGGPFQDISGSAMNGEWAGPEGATSRNDHKHLRRALYINIIAHILLLAALCASFVFSA